MAAASIGGVLMFGVQQKLYVVHDDPRWRWKLTSASIDPATIGRIDYRDFGFKVIADKRERGVQLPYWFAVTMLAVCIAEPWIRWTRRFSLRTLFIAITLFAMLLGVFAIRH